MSTLDAARVLRVHSMLVPPAGGWVGDLSLDATALPAIGPATLTIGDAVFTGRVTAAAMDDHPTGGARPRLTFEGGAGWGLPLRAGRYESPGGVRLSTVLRDLAALAGELYDAPPEAKLPAVYRWPASTAREPVTGRTILADLCRRGAIPTWHVDPATGRTVFAPWPALGAADAAVRVLSRNMSQGRRRVGLDARALAVLPGTTLEGATIRRLLIREDARKLEAEVWER